MRWLSRRLARRVWIQVHPGLVPMSVTDLLASHVRWLKTTAPKLVTPFSSQTRSHREAAILEAAARWFLDEHLGYDVTPIPPTDARRMPDFECRTGLSSGLSLVVECTHMDKDSVAETTGIPHSTPSWSGMLGFLTSRLQSEAKCKAAQLGDHPCARVLVIGTDHDAGFLMVDADAARRMIVGDFRTKVSMGGDSFRAEALTDATESLFLSLTDGQLTPARRSISAVLLVEMNQGGISIIGALHPDPAVPLDPDLLPGIPLCHLRCWPPRDGEFEVEFVVGRPRPPA